MPELRELRYFVTLAEELHFGHAAERLYLSQSALSHAIRRLERKLGFVLFHRAGGNVGMTEEGKQLLDDARRVITSADRLQVRAEEMLTGSRGRVAVAYVPSVQETTAAAIRRFAAVSGIGIEHQRCSHDRVIAFVEEGAIDVGIAHAAPAPDSLSAEYFTAKPLYAMVGPANPLYGRDAVSLDELEPFKIPYVHAAGRDIWRMLYAHHGLVADVLRIEDPVTGAPTDLLARDPGVAWMQTDEYGGTDRFKLIEIEPRVDFAFEVVYRDACPNPAAMAFVEQLRSSALRLV